MIEKAKRQNEGGERHRSGKGKRTGGVERDRKRDRRRWKEKRKNKKGGKQRYRERQEVAGKTAEYCELNEL